jgi:hypothetical protein
MQIRPDRKIYGNEVVDTYSEEEMKNLWLKG